MEFVWNDGGRKAAGYVGTTGDCVVRAIAIAAEKPYQEVYDALKELAKKERTGKRKKTVSSVSNGTYRVTYEQYLRKIGFKWVPTMKIGQGCKVHLVKDELPSGRLVVAVSKHLTAVIDGVIHDLYSPQRQTIIINDDGSEYTAERCVYGYYYKP